MSERKRILLVDDEPDFLAVIREGLEKEGFEVEEAYNGVDALEKVNERSPDAIVLDVMMPEMDGYAVCSELKEDKRYSDIPIIMLTAVASHVPSTRYSHHDGMTMEADDYLPKPASSELIIERVRRVLRL